MKIPPVVFLLLHLGAIYLSKSLVPIGLLSNEYAKMGGIIVAIIGSLLVIISVLAFRKHDTTVNPSNPMKAEHLVTTGLYKYSRNPIYLGFLFILIGATLVTHNIFGLVVCASFILLINRYQIIPEEKALSLIFGKSFQDYKSKVRRWI